MWYSDIPWFISISQGLKVFSPTWIHISTDPYGLDVTLEKVYPRIPMDSEMIQKSFPYLSAFENGQ